MKKTKNTTVFKNSNFQLNVETIYDDKGKVSKLSLAVFGGPKTIEGRRSRVLNKLEEEKACLVKDIVNLNSHLEDCEDLLTRIRKIRAIPADIKSNGFSDGLSSSSKGQMVQHLIKEVYEAKKEQLSYDEVSSILEDNNWMFSKAKEALLKRNFKNS